MNAVSVPTIAAKTSNAFDRAHYDPSAIVRCDVRFREHVSNLSGMDTKACRAGLNLLVDGWNALIAMEQHVTNDMSGVVSRIAHQLTHIVEETGVWGETGRMLSHVCEKIGHLAVVHDNQQALSRLNIALASLDDYNHPMVNAMTRGCNAGRLAIA